MIIDAHVHIGGPPPEAETDDLVTLLKRNKIDKAVVFRLFHGLPTRAGNELVRDAVSRYPDHLIGFAWIDPVDTNAIEEMRTAIKEWRFKGVKLHLEMSPAPKDRLDRIFAEAESLSVPLCIHLGESIGWLGQLCGRYSVDIIVAHLGTGVYNLSPDRLEQAIGLSHEYERIFLETSGNTYFFIEYAVKKVGPSRIIFGSDFPHEHPLVIEKAIDLLDISKEDKALIMGGNLCRLLGIHSAGIQSAAKAGR